MPPARTLIVFFFVMYMYLFVLFDLQADMYKKDFESERDDRTRLAGQIAQAKFSQTFKQEQRHFGEEEHLKKTKLESVQEAYTKAVKKVSDCDKEISDLRQTLQTKEETWKRSLEEARVSSSKLDDEVKLLTQQVKQYKKQADNLRSQLEKYEQMNKSQVQQVLYFADALKEFLCLHVDVDAHVNVMLLQSNSFGILIIC